MTASVKILKGDLHLAICGAFNRGRYELLTNGDGDPLEILIDLRERPDDLFDVDESDLSSQPTDDHGPTIPAQTRAGGYATLRPTSDRDQTLPPPDFVTLPRVYDFAVQDLPPFATPEGTRGRRPGIRPTLDNARLTDAPDWEARDRADWVHVYDRVTRERRTLKRPPADAVLTGLRDVASGLRSVDSGKGLSDT